MSTMTFEFKVRDEWITLDAEQVAGFSRSGQLAGQRYLDMIGDESIRELAAQFWRQAPAYFFVIPASSSGRHHWATGIGGLADHVFMGMYCAYELAATFGLTDLERDCAVAAIAGHDCLKYGIEYDARYFDIHPFLPRSYYRYLEDTVDTDDWETIMAAIERHMGSLAEGNWTSVGRIKPQTPVEQVVHLADYMSSRKGIVMAEVTS